MIATRILVVCLALTVTPMPEPSQLEKCNELPIDHPAISIAVLEWVIIGRWFGHKTDPKCEGPVGPNPLPAKDKPLDSTAVD